MKRFLLLLSCLFLAGSLCRAEVYQNVLKIEGGLRFSIDGLAHFEPELNIPTPAGYGYPIFTISENEYRFLGGFVSGLRGKMHCYGLPIPGKTISVSATFHSVDLPNTSRDYIWMQIMITPVKMAFAKREGKQWAHAIEDKIIYLEKTGAPGQTLSLSTSIRYEDSWDGAIISIRAGGEDEEGAVTICVFDDNKETEVVTSEAEDTSGDQEGGTIPWKWVVPGTLIGGGAIWVARNRNKKPKGGKKDKNKKKEKDKEKDREEDEQKPPSTFQMILWKNCGKTLVVGDPPVQMGARIEEITADGRRIDRSDLTGMVSIQASLPVVVEKKRREGQYMKADISVCEEGADQAKVTFVFNGPSGRLVHHLVFDVQGAPAILVEPAITFAAGQGKTLFMEFGLVGSLQQAENVSIMLEQRAAPYFKASLEQVGETPGLFRINLTEQSPVPLGTPEDEVLPGTIENYSCTIEALPPGKTTPVRESFDIYRVHLGLRLEIRALKSFLVELESTPDNDIMPPKGSQRTKKYAESRVDWQLLVVDEQDEGKIKSVRPDSGPKVTFEDDFANNMLFKPRDEENYVPTASELVNYEGCFFRSFDGKGIPSPCESLQFEYATIGSMPDGGYWGIIRPTKGYLASPNRSHVKVKFQVSWRGQVFTRELRVPLNSQPFRKVVVPEGSDIMRELSKWDDIDLERTNNLIDMQRKICLDSNFSELKPLFYKITVMLEGYDKAFGYDEQDYNNLMEIWRKYCAGEIGTTFVAKGAVSPDDENFEAAIATIASMDRSIPVIVCRIGLGIVTGGASEVVLTPLSSLVEMKEYVDKGGDSAWMGFAQISLKLIGQELLFYGGGKAIGKIKQMRAAKLEKAQALANKAKQIGEGTKKAAQTAKVTKSLSQRPAFSSAKNADKITQGANKAKAVVTESRKMADTAVKKTLEGGKAAKELAKDYADDAIRAVRGNEAIKREEMSLLREQAAKVAKKDGERIVEEFRRVMNNPTATKEEMRRATMALQGSKSAQEVLKTHPSDLLRANYNAQMQQFYDDIDPKVIKRLQEKIKVKSYLVEEPEIRVFKGATGNAGEELRLGRKIGADRDVTFQIKCKDGKWVDIGEDLMEEAYAETLNKELYGTISPDRFEMIDKTLHKLDQATVNGLLGKESYGADLFKIIDPARQAEKLGDPRRIAETYLHKCELWLSQGQKATEVAEQLLKQGYEDEALKVLGYGESLIKEGMRQNVKQFQRILIPRIEAAATKGVKLDYTKLMAKIRVLDSMGTPPPKGAIPISLEEARLVLQTQFQCSMEDVVKECAQAVMDVNAVL